MCMSIFDNLGLYRNSDGIAPGFAAPISSQQHIAAGHIKNAPNLSAFEMLVIAMIAKQLYES